MSGSKPIRRPKWCRLCVELLESRELLDSVPLNDLGPGLAQGFIGGLYPNGTDTRPPANEAAGESIARQIVPLNASGNVDTTNGRIVMISVGLSNTTLEFGTRDAGAFMPRANLDPSKNPQLVFVDGAQFSQTASIWADPTSMPWTVLNQRITAAGVTANQVEVAWVKLADKIYSGNDSFPFYARSLEGELAAVTRNLVTFFPHIRIAYYSSRIFSNDTFSTTAVNAINPEPFAYDSGLAVQWLITSQINGTGNLNYDPSQGPVVAPFLSWGPYLWADGTHPRSDGLVWLDSDLQADHVHPTSSGIFKVASQLLAFFKTDPTATPWFLRNATVGTAPTVDASAVTMDGGAPLTVQFNASASEPNGSIIQYAWTFDDGDSSLAQNPAVTFFVPGTYHVHLTVTDSAGNTVLRVLTITVPAQSPDHVFIAHLYQDLLGRNVDTAGLNGWGNQLDQGTVTRTQVAQGLEASTEFRGDVVDNLYHAVLGRAPEQAALDSWTSALAQGTTSEQLESLLFGSDEYFNQHGGTDSGYLTALYPAILNRPITASELQAGEQALGSGTSRAAVALGVLGTPESDALEAQAIYQQLFHQLPSGSTQATLVSELQQGTPNEQVLIELAGSDAYAQGTGGNANQLYVERLYNDLLHQAPDATSLAMWTSHLDNGSLTRQQVVAAILSNPGYHGVEVQDQYLALLHRQADPADVANFSNFLAQGNTIESLQAILAGSPEYYQNRGGGTNDGFLNALFEDALGRPVDAATQANMERALASGVSRTAIATVVFGSHEHQGHLVQQLYERFLGHPPSASELDSQVSALQSGARDDDVIAGLVRSTEYFLIP
jgi:PKD repeat protein